MTTPWFDGVAWPLLGSSAAIREVRGAIEALGPAPFPVLLTGETGTGKSAVALALHERSGRTGGFVSASATELVDGLAVAQLKGHARGAFTNAFRDSSGSFEQAHDGTLLLDEIADAEPQAQRLLLTLTDGRPIQRLGESRNRHLSVRLVSATNQHLDTLMAQGVFRRDLFYRLRMFEIALPPLRDRLDDVPAMVPHIMARLCERMGRSPEPPTPRLLQLLGTFTYPGNLRDLEAVVAHCLVLGRPPTWFTADPAGWRGALDTVLDATNGNVSEAARRLGKHRRSLHRELRERRRKADPPVEDGDQEGLASAG